MPNCFSAFGWSIDLAPGWTAEIRHDSACGETTAFAAIVPETDDALLRLTRDERGIMAAAKWVEGVGQFHLDKGRPVSAMQCGEFSGNTLEFESDGAWIRGWALCFGTDLLDVTYRCNARVKGRDDPAVDKMLSTLRYLEASPDRTAAAVDTNNPYRSPSDGEDSLRPKLRKSKLRRFLVGFCVGAAIPAVLGAFGIYSFNVHVALLPPDTPVCGNAVMGSIILILFVAPILGLIGGTIAAALP